MKIRNGFVSNSSSTSFVLTCAKEDYDQILNDLGPQAQYIANQFRHSIKGGKLFGKEVISISGVDCSEDRDLDVFDGFGGDITDKDGNIVHVEDWEFVDESGNYVEYDDVISNSYTLFSAVLDQLKKGDKDVIYETDCC